MIKVKNLQELLASLNQNCEVEFDGCVSLTVQGAGVCDYVGRLSIFRNADLYSIESVRLANNRPVFRFQFFGGAWAHYVPKSHQSTDMEECARAVVKLADRASSLDAVVSLYVK